MALTWPSMDEGKWNLVASNVVTGYINRLKGQYTFWGTEVATGAAAPADTEEYRDKCPKLFEDSNTEPIDSQTAIDIYIWIENADTETDETGITNSIRVNI